MSSLADHRSRETQATHALPGWLGPLLLAGLVVIAGVIALAGWLLMSPPSPVATQPAPPLAVAERAVETAAPAAIEEHPAPKEPPALPEELPRPQTRVAGTSPLQRRTPPVAEQPDTPAETVRQMWPNIDPPTPAETVKQMWPKLDSPPPAKPVQEMTLQSPLRWTVESPGAGSASFIVPIEIARVDDGTIPHSIRRLQFTDTAPKALKLAVTPVFHDDLGSVLSRMGDGYAFTQLRKEDVFSFDTLKKHDVVFLTCADMYIEDFRAAVPLRKFVAHGGTLYASDLRGDLLQAAFPEFRAKTPLLHGVPQTIEASVVESGLQSFLGRKAIPLHFEAPDWRPAPFDPFKVTVCLSGIYRNNLGQSLTAPLLVKFRFQKGTVIFTSFHHAKNDSEIVRKLLDYLVFASVNARSEARVKDLMQRSNFAPNELRPVVLNAGQKREAAHNHPGGTMQIALGFEHLGAKLKLTLRSPSGKTIEHADQGLYLIEVPKAEPGAWRYTVTPIDLPHPNFPLIVAVGSAKS
jgi:hypothetical protein